MRLNSLLEGLTTTDRILIGLATLGLVIGMLLLLNEDLFNSVFGFRTTEDPTKPLIGFVAYKLNDTRYKNSQTIMWSKAKKQQNIRLGDSLFTGQNSRSQVQLKDGNEVILDENTLVVFSEVSKLMDLSSGNFRFKVDGRLTFSIQGQATTIEGHRSDIQVIVPQEKNQKPQVRLLGGQAHLQIQDQKPLALQMQKVEDLPISPSAMHRHTASEQNSTQEEPISIEAASRHLMLYDVFELKDNQTLVRRSALPEEARSLLPLNQKISMNSFKSPSIYLDDNNKTHLVLSAQKSEDWIGYVFEVSTSREFPANKTRAQWSQDHRLKLQWSKPGVFFYRVRGVNHKTELTSPSEPMNLAVLPQPKLIITADKKPPQKLTPPPIHQRPTLSPTTPAPAQKLTKSQPPERQLAATANSSTRTTTAPSPGPTNINYNSSRVDMEYGTFTVYSPDESDVGKTPPLAHIVGARSKHWFGRHGVEGMARVKVGDLNETAKGINPLQLEVRYHHRLGATGLGLLQTSLLAGYEFYRNIGRGYFTQAYDLAKLGLALDFPVGHRWDAGGDLVFGIGADQTKKYEALGRLNYYFSPKNSFGVGYRLHLLEAGSEKTAPFEFPYKETYGEGFLVFRFHY